MRKHKKTNKFQLVWLCFVHPSVDSSFAVWLTPRSQVIKVSQKTLRCAAHRGIKPRGVHPTAESSSAVWYTLQTALCRVKIGFLWVSGTIRRSLLGVNTSIMKEKIWRKNFWFAKTTILTPQCHAHSRVEFFELCDRISRRIQNQIRK